MNAPAPRPLPDAAALRAALHQVIDPELGIDIVELGLIYRLDVAPDRVDVDLTATSPACPMAHAIADEVQDVLEGLLPEGTTVTIHRVDEPPWSPECMSERARRTLGWDAD